MITLYYRHVGNKYVTKCLRNSLDEAIREKEAGKFSYDHWLEADVPSHIENCVVVDLTVAPYFVQKGT